MKIGFIGFQGVGKSTLGAKVASSLSLPHVDLDTEVCRALNIASPKNTDLETFRAVERQMPLDYSHVVLSFGGGALDSIRRAHGLGYSLVYLYRPFEEFDFSHSPVWLQNRDFISVWNERHPLFSSVADYTLYAPMGKMNSLLQEVVARYGK